MVLVKQHLRMTRHPMNNLSLGKGLTSVADSTGPGRLFRFAFGFC